MLRPHSATTTPWDSYTHSWASGGLTQPADPSAEHTAAPSVRGASVISTLQGTLGLWVSLRLLFLPVPKTRLRKLRGTHSAGERQEGRSDRRPDTSLPDPGLMPLSGNLKPGIINEGS